MRYRALSADGDYTFGQSQANFLVDSAAMVAQSVLTRLRLMEGEWFLDRFEGTPYASEILGKHKDWSYDLAIRERVLRTIGVREIIDYQSDLEDRTRALTVQMTITTDFGPAEVQAVF